MTSQLLDPVARVLPTVEVISSEEAASKLNEFNNKLQRGEIPTYNGLVVGSIDASALYPSINIGHASKLCWERMRTSGIKFPHFDLEWATIYLALNYPKTKKDN